MGARLLDNEGDISSGSFDDHADDTDTTRLEEGVKRRGQSPGEEGSRVFSRADTELVLALVAPDPSSEPSEPCVQIHP